MPAIVQHDGAQNCKVHTGFADPQKQIDVLAVKQRVVKHPNSVEHLSPIQTGAQMNMEEGFDARIFSRRQRRRVQPVETAHETRHHALAGECLQVTELTRQLAIRPEIIGVKKCNDPAAGSCDSLVAHDTRLSRFALQQADRHAVAGKARDEVGCAVGRGTIDDDNLGNRTILTDDGRDRVAQEAGHIDGRDDHRDIGHDERPAMNADIVSINSLGSDPRLQ